MKYRTEVLRIDPRATADREPWKWPSTPEGRMGTRWIVRDGDGEVIGLGDNNSNSAWRRAYYTLRERER